MKNWLTADLFGKYSKTEIKSAEKRIKKYFSRNPNQLIFEILQSLIFAIAFTILLFITACLIFQALCLVLVVFSANLSGVSLFSILVLSLVIFLQINSGGQKKKIIQITGILAIILASITLIYIFNSK